MFPVVFISILTIYVIATFIALLIYRSRDSKRDIVEKFGVIDSLRSKACPNNCADSTDPNSRRLIKYDGIHKSALDITGPNMATCYYVPAQGETCAKSVDKLTLVKDNHYAPTMSYFKNVSLRTCVYSGSNGCSPAPAPAVKETPTPMPTPSPRCADCSGRYQDTKNTQKNRVQLTVKMNTATGEGIVVYHWDDTRLYSNNGQTDQTYSTPILCIGDNKFSWALWSESGTIPGETPATATYDPGSKKFSWTNGQVWEQIVITPQVSPYLPLAWSSAPAPVQNTVVPDISGTYLGSFFGSKTYYVHFDPESGQGYVKDAKWGSSKGPGLVYYDKTNGKFICKHWFETVQEVMELSNELSIENNTIKSIMWPTEQWTRKEPLNQRSLTRILFDISGIWSDGTDSMLVYFNVKNGHGSVQVHGASSRNHPKKSTYIVGYIEAREEDHFLDYWYDQLLYGAIAEVTAVKIFWKYHDGAGPITWTKTGNVPALVSP